MNRRMKLLGDAAGAAAVIGLGLGGAGTATASAASHPAVKVIQNCGKYRACASYRPATFSLGFGKVKQIHWYRYNSGKRSAGATSASTTSATPSSLKVTPASS